MSSNAGDTGHAGPTRSSERERHDPRGDRAWNAGGSRAPMFTYDASMADLVLEYSRARLSMDPDQVGIWSLSSAERGGAGRSSVRGGQRPSTGHGDLRGRDRAVADPPRQSELPRLHSPRSNSSVAPVRHARFVGILECKPLVQSAGAIVAENQALRLLADLAGLPTRAGGCFVTGGSAANLSALLVAREHHKARIGEHRRPPRFAVSAEAHASIALALKVIGLDVLEVPTDDHRVTGEGLRAALAADPDHADCIGVVATAGTTNAGIVDDLSGIAEVARTADLWFHVDGAYGAAALLVPELRELFRGIEHADSLVIDPHKWLFAPYDCGALLYREPGLARQRADAAGVLLGGADRGRWLESVRLRVSPHAPTSGLGVVVFAGGPRHEGVQRGDRERRGDSARMRTAHR